MPLQPIQRASVIESVTEQLLSMIGDGSFRPGDKLPSNREIAATLGVGRSSVREAIQRLVMLRVLEARQGLGVFVRQPQSTDAVPTFALFALLEMEALGDVLEAREVLEAALAAFAARRATPADLDEIAQSLADERRAMDVEEAVVRSTSFHLAMVGAAHSPVLEKLYTSIVDLVHLRQRTFAQAKLPRSESLMGHQAIFEAIAARDPAGARRAVEAHMAYNRRLIEAEHEAARSGKVHGVPSETTGIVAPSTSATSHEIESSPFVTNARQER